MRTTRTLYFVDRFQQKNKKKDGIENVTVIAKRIILYPVYPAGKVSGKKQWTELSVFLSEGIHRGGTETGHCG